MARINESRLTHVLPSIQVFFCIEGNPGLSGLTQFFPSEDSGDNGQEQNVPQQIDLTEDDDDEDEPVADPTDIETGNEITSKMFKEWIAERVPGSWVSFFLYAI